jgi:Tripartite tricarboxylate transporter TctB family
MDAGRRAARADLVASGLWLALGIVAVHQSWTMDRLEAQGADPWSAPGLVPGLVGTILILLGAALLLRSLRPAGVRTAAEPAGGEAEEDPAEAGEGRRRLGIALLLCLLLVFGLIGRGLPF